MCVDNLYVGSKKSTANVHKFDWKNKYSELDVVFYEKSIPVPGRDLHQTRDQDFVYVTTFLTLLYEPFTIPNTSKFNDFTCI